MKNRKWMALALAAAMVGSLTACGGGSGTADTLSLIHISVCLISLRDYRRSQWLCTWTLSLIHI